MSKTEFTGVLLIIGALITIPILGSLPQKITPPIVKDLKFKQPNETVQVKKITVLETDLFDLILLDDRRIKAKLTVDAASEGKAAVVKLLNHITNPQVVLLEKTEDGWLVDFLFEVDGKSTSLAYWLTEKNLVFK